MNPLQEKHRALGQMRMMMSGGGGGGSSSSSSSISYPDELKPLLTNVANLSNQMANTPWQAYGDQRYADLNDTQKQALGMVTDRATNGSPVMDQANQTLTSMLQGGETNPYLDDMVGRAQKSMVDSYNTTTKPQMESAQVGSGSFGNSGLQQMQQQSQDQLQQNLGGVATQMYGDAYKTNEANKLAALGMAQGYGNQAYIDADKLLSAGDVTQNQEQNNADFNYEQYLSQQDDPYKRLQAMTGVLNNSAGSTTTTKQSGGRK